MSAVTTLPASETEPEAGSAESPPGLRSGFRLLLEHLGDHVELLRLEAGQELSRLGTVIGHWFALALLVQLSLMMGLTLLVASYWHTEYRTHTILLAAVLLLGGVVFCVAQLKRFGHRASQRFSHSGAQLKRDLDLIRELL